MCKKLTFMLMVLAIVGLAVPASAGQWLRGDWNGWGDDVNFPTQDPMTDNLDGTFTRTMTGFTASERVGFKVYDDIMETWYPGSNSWLYADGAGAITVGYNTNTVSDGFLPTTSRLGLSTDGNNVGWVIAGSFGEPNGPGYPDWSNTGIPMTALGGGIYRVGLNLPMGGGPSWIEGNEDGNIYAWKAVVYGSWDSIAESGRNVNTANSFVTVSPGYEGEVFYVDAYTGVVRTGIPEPATCLILGLGIVGLVMRRRRC